MVAFDTLWGYTILALLIGGVETKDESLAQQKGNAGDREHPSM